MALPHPDSFRGFGRIAVGRWAVEIFDVQKISTTYALQFFCYALPIDREGYEVDDGRKVERVGLSLGLSDVPLWPSRNALGYANLIAFRCASYLENHPKCCVRHLMLKRYDGYPCVGVKYPPRRISSRPIVEPLEPAANVEPYPSWTP